VGPVPRGQGSAAELEVRLVHEGGGVQGALAVLAAELPPGDAAKIVAHQRDEPL